MLIKRKRHNVPLLNSASTADISFMLLTFFLMTTSMDIDKGLVRILPSVDEALAEETIVEKDNLLAFVITPDDRLMVNGVETSMAEIKGMVEKFVVAKGDDHAISIAADPSSSYNTYFALEHEIAVAYNNLRDKTALTVFGRKYSNCDEGQRTAIAERCPQRIYEINEPVNVQEGDDHDI